jgi:hypothetical protein
MRSAMPRACSAFVVAAVLVALPACNNSGSGSGGQGGSGGAGGAGGPAGSGGTTPGSTAGPGTGGAPGGAPGSGGASVLAGSGGKTTGTGGSTAGGSSAAGGGVGTGGSSGMGGLLASGGAPGTGGATRTGGAPGTGGAAATGGVPGTGGVSRTGGTTGAGGGTTSTAACQESTCGSHKWACWKVPTPPKENLPNPQSYTDLGNGAVRDNVTCLVWEKANPATQGDWQASVDRCAGLASSNYAGFNDWRLPTRMEMASIIDPNLGSKGFPTVFTTTSGYYATGSWWYETITGQSTSGFHWAYGTNGFTSNAVAMSGTNLVARCVRGNGTGEAADVLAVEPPNHYTIGTGEVTDNYTGLVWQQGFSPSLMDWASAPAYCAGLTLNGHTGFRLPTLGELSSSVNEAKVGGAVVATAFPGNPNGCKDPKYWFWASESYSSTADWGLSYCDGFTGYNVGASGAWNYFPTANVRCVRNGP